MFLEFPKPDTVVEFVEQCPALMITGSDTPGKSEYVSRALNPIEQICDPDRTPSPPSTYVQSSTVAAAGPEAVSKRTALPAAAAALARAPWACPARMVTTTRSATGSTRQDTTSAAADGVALARASSRPLMALSSARPKPC